LKLFSKYKIAGLVCSACYIGGKQKAIVSAYKKTLQYPVLFQGIRNSIIDNAQGYDKGISIQKGNTPASDTIDIQKSSMFAYLTHVLNTRKKVRCMDVAKLCFATPYIWNKKYGDVNGEIMWQTYFTLWNSKWSLTDNLPSLWNSRQKNFEPLIEKDIGIYYIYCSDQELQTRKYSHENNKNALVLIDICAPLVPYEIQIYNFWQSTVRCEVDSFPVTLDCIKVTGPVVLKDIDCLPAKELLEFCFSRDNKNHNRVIHIKKLLLEFPMFCGPRREEPICFKDIYIRTTYLWAAHRKGAYFNYVGHVYHKERNIEYRFDNQLEENIVPSK
jgi:hypothetical protein